MQYFIFLILAFLAGSALSIQGGANAELARILGNPITASLVSALISITLMICLIFIFKAPLPKSPVMNAPWWTWLGGIMGVYFLIVGTITVPAIGTANFLVMVIAGQVVAALFIDKFGLLNIPVHQLSINRIIGVIFVIIGAIFINYKNKPH